MDRTPASAAETSPLNVFMRRTAAARHSKTQSMRPSKQTWFLVKAEALREFKSMNAHIQALQQQVNDLYAHLNALRNGQSLFPMHPSLAHADSPAQYRGNMSPSEPRTSHPPFQGPTSSAFNLDVAKSSLQTMGITTQSEAQDDAGSGDIDPALDGPATQHHAPVAAMATAHHKDPLWQLSKDDAVRLCKVYDEDIGMMYPILDMAKLLEHAEILFSFIESTIRSGVGNRDLAGADALEGNDINILKMVLASALVAEGGGESPLGRALYESCREAFECKLTGPVDIKGLRLLVIVVCKMSWPIRSYEKALTCNLGGIPFPTRRRGTSISYHWP